MKTDQRGSIWRAAAWQITNERSGGGGLASPQKMPDKNLAALAGIAQAASASVWLKAQMAMRSKKER
jgi:hypothetical protein